MITYSGIMERIFLLGIVPNIEQFLGQFMAKKRADPTASKSLGKIRRGIFQGDSLYPLTFVLCIISLSLILMKEMAGYSAHILIL